MPSPPATTTPPDAQLDQLEQSEDNTADLPLTMAASVVLDHLPRDAHRALETAGELELAKGALSIV